MVDKDKSIVKSQLKRVNVKQIEDAVAKALGELAGVEYTAKIIELNFGDSWRETTVIRLEISRSFTEGDLTKE